MYVRERNRPHVPWAIGNMYARNRTKVWAQSGECMCAIRHMCVHDRARVCAQSGTRECVIEHTYERNQAHVCAQLGLQYMYEHSRAHRRAYVSLKSGRRYVRNQVHAYESPDTCACAIEQMYACVESPRASLLVDAATPPTMRHRVQQYPSPGTTIRIYRTMRCTSEENWLFDARKCTSTRI